MLRPYLRPPCFLHGVKAGKSRIAIGIQVFELIEGCVDGAVLEPPVGRHGDEEVPGEEGADAQEYEDDVYQLVLVDRRCGRRRRRRRWVQLLGLSCQISVAFFRHGSSLCPECCDTYNLNQTATPDVI